MGDRLVELLNKCEVAYEKYLEEGKDKAMKGHPERLLKTFEFYADYLLKNNVIAMPCNVGDDIWYIDENEVRCEKADIHKVIYCGNGKFEIMDRHGSIDEVGTTFAYLSKEEAEQALKEREQK